MIFDWVQLLACSTSGAIKARAMNKIVGNDRSVNVWQTTFTHSLEINFDNTK